MTDVVNRPAHYADGWSNGAEVIDITENLNFCRGNAVKYIARAGKKDPAKELEDLEKAEVYLKREIQRIKLVDAPAVVVNRPRRWESLEDVPKDVDVASSGGAIWHWYGPEDPLGAPDGEWLYTRPEGVQFDYDLMRQPPFTEVRGG